MVQVLGSSWALLLGIMLLMVGNGVQGTLLGIRGGIEGFSTYEMSAVMSAYFVGFLGGSRMAPDMIRRVGHVRVFAALGSFISAVLILYPTLVTPGAWILGRVVIGFCFSAVYVTAESWLNNSATNETRGQVLSAYLIVQMVGIIAAQMLLVSADPSGYVLFVIPSVLVSISFAPILLSVSPTPPFESTRPMSLRELYARSPLACVGMFLLGGIFSAQFGMSSVYGTEAGLSVARISAFVSAFYVGALVAQYPLGWLSDRMDRRVVIAAVAGAGAAASLIAMLSHGSFAALVVSAFVIGGASNPLYSLLLAYANDYLEQSDMAAASAGMVFINGVGAVTGPLLIGWVMQQMGPQGYFIVLFALLAAVSGYTVWRMGQRKSAAAPEGWRVAPIPPSAGPVMVEAAQEYLSEGEDSPEAI